MIILAAKQAPPAVKAELWRCKRCGVQIYLTDPSLGDLARKGSGLPYCGPCVLTKDGVRNIRGGR